MPPDRPAATPAKSAPAAPDWLLYLGIFAIFGPLGMLFGMVWDNASGWAGALIMAVFSGTIAVGWSFSFTTRRVWLLVPIILGSFVVPFRLFPWLGKMGVFDIGRSLGPEWRRGILSIAIIAGVTAGFALIIAYIRRGHGRQLGLAGVRAAFEKNAARPLDEVFDAVLGAAAAFGTTSDDRTLVLVRVI